jgi:D-alanine transaminase
VEEGPFSVADAKAAKEAFITAASAYVTPITAIDGAPVGDGRPGAVTLRLRSLYVQQAEAEAV